MNIGPRHRSRRGENGAGVENDASHNAAGILTGASTGIPSRQYTRRFLRLGAQESNGKGPVSIRQYGVRGGRHRRVAAGRSVRSPRAARLAR